MSRMEDLAETESLLRSHLGSWGIPFKANQSPWTLSPSPHGGRGVFTSRDVPAGGLVFMDAPLVLGPRAGARCPPLCVGCHSSGGAMVACSKGCGLPVCGRNCEVSNSHSVECDYLVRWRNKEDSRAVTWCPLLLRAVTPIRCLGLDVDQRRLVRRLQTHTGPQHEREMELIQQSVGDGPSVEDDEFMRVCCRAMDANAFEVEVPCPRDSLDVQQALRKSLSSLDNDNLDIPVFRRPQNLLSEDLKDSLIMPSSSPEKQEILSIPNGREHSPTLGAVSETVPNCKSSLRGLYPLSAMMNHACTPNTRHGYDVAHRMVVRAVTAIPQGTEITTSYSALLWGTPARRHHLAMTKHFLCACARCRDPQEGGSRLCALKCAKNDCPGVLLPLDPIQANTKWACDLCGLRMPDKQARLIQASLAQMLSTVSTRGPQQVVLFLRGHQALLPTSNQLVVEIKSSLVWALGHRQGYKYFDLSEEDLAMKKDLCKELLTLLDVLQAGQSRMRGLLLYELQGTLLEKQRRSTEESKVDQVESQEALQEVLEMFVDDVTSPALH